MDVTSKFRRIRRTLRISVVDSAFAFGTSSASLTFAASASGIGDRRVYGYHMHHIYHPMYILDQVKIQNLMNLMNYQN